MTTLQREALQMCLEYIETNAHERRHVRWKIQEALAQPAPVQELGARVDAVVAKIKAGIAEKPTALNSYGLKLWDSVRDDLLALATPPAAQRPWVGLTDRKVGKVIDDVHTSSQYGHHHTGFWMDFYRAIEAELKEKNS